MRLEDVGQVTGEVLRALGVEPCYDPASLPGPATPLMVARVGFVDTETGDVYRWPADVPGDHPEAIKVRVAMNWALDDMAQGVHGAVEELMGRFGEVEVTAAVCALGEWATRERLQARMDTRGRREVTDGAS